MLFRPGERELQTVRVVIIKVNFLACQFPRGTLLLLLFFRSRDMEGETLNINHDRSNAIIRFSTMKIVVFSQFRKFSIINIVSLREMIYTIIVSMESTFVSSFINHTRKSLRHPIIVSNFFRKYFISRYNCD